MKRQPFDRRLRWVLFASNLLAGIAGLLAALGPGNAGQDVAILWLAIGVLNLVASGVWLLSVTST